MRRMTPERSVKETGRRRPLVEWPHDDFSALPFRVVWIVVDPRQRIAEYRESFVEGYTVFPKVRGGLHGIPRKSCCHQRQAYHLTICGPLSDGLTLHIRRGGRTPVATAQHGRHARPSPECGGWAAPRASWLDLLAVTAAVGRTRAFRQYASSCT